MRQDRSFMKKKKVSLNVLKSTKKQHVQAGNISVHNITLCLVFLLAKMSHPTLHSHFLFSSKVLIDKQDWWLLSVSGKKAWKSSVAAQCWAQLAVRGDPPLLSLC